MKNTVRQYFALILISLFSVLYTKAESTVLCGLTNDAQIIPISDIECLVGDGDTPTFSVFTKTGDIIPNINSMTFGFRKVSSTSAINDIAMDGEMQIRNNAIEVSMLGRGECLSLLDMQGHMLWSCISDGSKISIDVTAYPSGYYILKAGNQTYKMLKK